MFEYLSMFLSFIAIYQFFVYVSICHFTLLEKPSPPTNIEAQSSAPQTIEITWDDPLVTNGPITNYIVSYTTNGQTRNRTIGSNQKNQITLSLSDNILSGVTYNVFVQAVNGFGISDPSEVVSVTASSASSK